MNTNTGSEHRILLGQIVRAHGIRGDVIVRSFTDDPADIASYGALTDAGGQSPLTLSIVRVSVKGVVARVKGVSDRNGAEALCGRELYVERARLPETDSGVYYHADLIGLIAVDTDGTVVGRITAVQNFGAGDLLEIARDGTKETELIPFTDACVPEVDLGARRVTVVPPETTGEPEPRDEPSDDTDGGPDDRG